MINVNARLKVHYVGFGGHFWQWEWEVLYLDMFITKGNTWVGPFILDKMSIMQ